jgi:hypothetical protein
MRIASRPVANRHTTGNAKDRARASCPADSGPGDKAMDGRARMASWQRVQEFNCFWVQRCVEREGVARTMSTVGLGQLCSHGALVRRALGCGSAVEGLSTRVVSLGDCWQTHARQSQRVGTRCVVTRWSGSLLLSRPAGDRRWYPASRVEAPRWGGPTTAPERTLSPRPHREKGLSRRLRPAGCMIVRPLRAACSTLTW